MKMSNFRLKWNPDNAQVTIAKNSVDKGQLIDAKLDHVDVDA